MLSPNPALSSALSRERAIAPPLPGAAAAIGSERMGAPNPVKLIISRVLVIIRMIIIITIISSSSSSSSSIIIITCTVDVCTICMYMYQRTPA